LSPPLAIHTNDEAGEGCADGGENKSDRDQHEVGDG
jgi:hypothetical protein